MTEGQGIDPILVAVISSRLDSITKEIGQTMLRTSRSPIFSEARDFVTAVFDDQLRLVTQTAYIPALLGGLTFAMKSIEEHFRGEIYEGDIFILNDPYLGNNHPPDITVAKPVFYEGELCFWSVTRGHHTDVGGRGVAGYNPEATSVWEDGLRIPPAKLYERSRYQKDVWNMILLNVHMRFMVEGDLHCQVGAARIGERGILAVLQKYGAHTVARAVSEILSATERQMAQEIERIPRGIFRAERRIDHDGVDKDRTFAVKLAISVDEGHITFDFAGTDPQARGYINSPIANTASACYQALFSSIDPDVKLNEGSLRRIKIAAPEGTLANPREPASVSACTLLSLAAIVETVWMALSQAIPDQVQAAWGRWAGPITTGFNPRLGRSFAISQHLAKPGAGAACGFDGWSHIGPVSSMGGARAPDPELYEIVTNYRLLEYEYQPDSGGPGKWRGGLGVHNRWMITMDGVRGANIGGGVRDETATFGLIGGKGSPKARLSLQRADGTVRTPDVNTLFSLNKGDIFEIRSSGGGGYGPPWERAIDKVWEDVRNEVVSVESARQDYSVVIDPVTLLVDYEATDRLRGKTSGIEDNKPRRDRGK
ncbi:MAG: hydantoinase B/oxoprolinase family protein [Chloroflexi bacterium]|nr:hydantoinase B/oxoprolinase family protein [Chloroflexota bacterium]